MGGQACVFYGAAEFSRDCDIVMVADQANLTRLTAALTDLQAECIAVPSLDVDYLQRGHAVHFRCQHSDARGIRLDIMTRMRGCDDFEKLWDRRTTIVDEEGFTYELLSVEDLVKAKKTQRDKDWPMIRRLVESHYDQFKDAPTSDMIKFWLRESRTPAMVATVAREHPEYLEVAAKVRPLLLELDLADIAGIERLLWAEELHERKSDEEYWRPLKVELENLRAKHRRSP